MKGGLLPHPSDTNTGRLRSDGVSLSPRESSSVWKSVTQTRWQRFKASLNPFGPSIHPKVARVETAMIPFSGRGHSAYREAGPAVKELGAAEYDLSRAVRARQLLHNEINRSAVTGPINFARNSESAAAGARRASAAADLATVAGGPTLAPAAAVIGQVTRGANTGLQLASGASWAVVSSRSKRHAELESTREGRALHSHIADYSDIKMARRQKGATLGFASIDLGAADATDELVELAGKRMGRSRLAKDQAVETIESSTMALLDGHEDKSARRIQRFSRVLASNRKAAGAEKMQGVVAAAVHREKMQGVFEKIAQSGYQDAHKHKMRGALSDIAEAAMVKRDKREAKAAQEMHSTFVAQSGAKTLGARFNEWRGKPSINTQIQQHLGNAAKTTNRQERHEALEQAKKLTAQWQAKHGSAGSQLSKRGIATESLKSSISKLGK